MARPSQFVPYPGFSKDIASFIRMLRLGNQCCRTGGDLFGMRRSKHQNLEA